MGRALITGASSGLGKEFAKVLAEQGNDLVLVARSQDTLEALANELHACHGVNVEVLPADLSLHKGSAAVAQRLRDDAAPIGLLVNNAGFGLGQEFIGGNVSHELKGVHVMVHAVLELSHAAANAMVARGRGAIINVASITSMTTQGTYSAHKAWVKVFSEGLAAELAGSGVHVTAVLPGLMHTAFHSRSHVDASQWLELTFIDTRKVVLDALDAARRGKVLVTPSLLYKAAYGALKFAPRALVRAVAGPKMSGRSAGIPKKSEV
ncbi:MAG: SDR family NAD(P)-dependent oxidoreductase [Actinomycetaceae bacterium]|nr:SDR family NAD(P)-dependent oxidoreductase [Arcanobacterium sp.]MDD7504554.1 SDR family NAD(P)-dependent oxidoreductase [Actinomycetaceae bacterium]MDY6143197.1 SDR family NAD(P)-dependent oxidoreductase [Arcanobacterium sp.]